MATLASKGSLAVSAATQFAVLPLMAAIDGFLRGNDQNFDLRVTAHRVMAKDGHQLLQQICPYVGTKGIGNAAKIGRTYPVTEGIMGKAYATGDIWRTKAFESADDLKNALAQDMADVGDTHPLPETPLSYLAIPLLAPKPDHETVMVIYADCDQHNFFADDANIKKVVDICAGFCRVIDFLDQSPLEQFKNQPIMPAPPLRDRETVFPRVQECVNDIEAPHFTALKSFNIELAA